MKVVNKIPHECQPCPPEEDHDHAYDNAPDQYLTYHFQHLIGIARIAHLLPPVR